MQKEFKTKGQNKDDNFQENLDDDSESTKDDEIDEEEVRRSTSCNLFLIIILKTQYDSNIANFSIHIHKPLTLLTIKLQNCILQYNDCLYTFVIICADDQSVSCTEVTWWQQGEQVVLQLRR